MAATEFRQLDIVSLGAYIRATQCLSSKLGNQFDDMQVQVVEDGLMNFVYIVQSSGGSMVVKQALPYARCVGESWPVSKERASYEAKALQVYATLCPSHVPQLYHFDHTLSLIAMAYLEPPHILLRKGFIAGIQYPLLAENVSEFFATVFFHSSCLYTNTIDQKRAVAEFCGNSEMTRLMEMMAFAPFEESQHVRWTSPELDLDVKAVQEDNTVKLEVANLKSMFSERTQALIHADFHAGSIMVTQHSVKVIDPEFAFYGPMGYDIGTFFRNLVVSFFAQDGFAADDHQNYRQNAVYNVKAYKIWLLKTLEETWNLFQQKFLKLWDEHKDGSGEVKSQMSNNAQLRKLLQKTYMEDVLQDAIGFCATSLIGSVIHIGPVEDFESIVDVTMRADCERKTLNFGKLLLKERNKFNSIGEVISSLQQYVDEHPDRG